MKRMTFLLGAAAALALAAPVSAKAQSCAWWNLACNGLAPVVVDNGWHIAGRDANGNVLYMRRRVDSNGNLLFEQARRSYFGNYNVFNNHILTRGNIYTANGERCSYTENSRGYKEQCKYAKGAYVSGVRYPSSRFGTLGSDCKYSSNDKGYKEQCKYDKAYNTAYKAGKVKTVTYKAPKYKPVKYVAPKAAKIHTVKPKAIKYDVKPAKVHTAKVHAAKAKGPKH